MLGLRLDLIGLTEDTYQSVKQALLGLGSDLDRIGHGLRSDSDHSPGIGNILSDGWNRLTSDSGRSPTGLLGISQTGNGIIPVRSDSGRTPIGVLSE